MKKAFYYMSLVCMCLTLQGCPSPNNPDDPNNPNTPSGQTNTNHRIGNAYVVSPADSIVWRSYDVSGGVHQYTYLPSVYLQQMSWSPEQHDTIVHSTEKHELHVQKKSNKSESVVLVGSRIYINGELWGFNGFSDPADTIQYIKDALGNMQEIVVHKKIAPYALEDVIEQLEQNYPELVYRINDTAEHHFSNYQVTMDKSLIPRITIAK